MADDEKKLRAAFAQIAQSADKWIWVSDPEGACATREPPFAARVWSERGARCAALSPWTRGDNETRPTRAPPARLRHCT